MIKASVIVPMYNSEKYVDQCLTYITRQTLRDMEIILIIRESTDGTVEKCVEWKKRDSRIRVQVTSGKGLGYARNYALDIAKGEYISFVDADDTIELDYLEKMIRPLEADQSIDITCCGFDRKLYDGSVIDGWMPSKQGLVEVDFNRYCELIYYGTVWLKVYRKDFLIANKLYQYKDCHEDDAMHLMLAAIVKHVFFIQEVLYHYNNDNMQSLLHNRENDLQYYEAMRFAINYLKSINEFTIVRRDIYYRIRNKTKQYFSETSDMRFIEQEKRLLQSCFAKELTMEQVREDNKKKKFSEEIVVYGYGADGQSFLRDINKSKVLAIIDNKATNQEMYTQEVPIYTFAFFLKKRIDADIVICSTNYYTEIEEQLYDKGIKTYYSVEDYIEKWRREQ